MEYIAHISDDKKRIQTVYAHLTGTAELAATFAAAFDAEKTAYRCGILHDIGKYSDSFQRRINGSGERVDHSTAGAIEIMRRRDVPAALSIAGHHGGLPNMGGRGDDPSAGTLMGRIKRKPGSELADYSAYEKEVCVDDAALPTALVSGAWTAFSFAHMLFSCLVDADWLDTEAFMKNGAVQRGTGESLTVLSDKLDEYVSKWWGATEPLNARRCDILRQMLAAGSKKKGLYTLTVPTGGGKTVSSMAFALRHAVKNGQRRIIYVIPYTSIIEQTQAVFEKIFGAENVVAHFANVEYSADENGNLSAIDKRRYLASENWDAPVILTTAVQFFESLFSDRPSSCRKLHNIANSVIIFDEAQMLPVNYLVPCVRMIAELVKHYGCTALLCTATQPSLQPLIGKFYNDDVEELCSHTHENHSFFRRVTYRREGMLSDEALAARLGNEDQVLCIVNNRRQAQEVYAILPQEGSFHLSTLMTPQHRRIVLNEIRNRLRDGKVCRVVSTSLIEAGVDVDFPVVYRAIAGLDSIIQAAGRCNREGRKEAEESIVYIFDSETTPPRGLAQNIAASCKVIAQFEDIASPAAISAYFAHLFYTLKGEDALDEKHIQRLAEQSMAFETVARQFKLIENSGYTIYVPLGDGADLAEELQRNGPSRSLMRKLGQYAVSVHEKDYIQLYKHGDVEAVSENAAILLRAELYSEKTGLCPSAEQSFLFC